VQKMVRDAESHAEDDRKRRELISLRNDAESMVYQAENILKEQGEQIPADMRGELDLKIQTVKEILDKDPENIDRLKPAYEAMVETLSKVGTAMYEAAAASQSNGASAGFEDAPESGGESEEATVEGEFREVGN